MDKYAVLLTAVSVVISALTPILLAIIARRQAQNLHETAARVAEVKTDLSVTSNALAQNVETIHVAVNSERTKMLEKLEAMHREIAGLREDNAALTQSAKDKDKD